jgi:FAD/FMN-containing dehydrogenase
MSDLRIRTTNGADAVLRSAEVERFAAGFRGQLLTAESPGYDQARSIWNAMIDRRPALIARCSGTADVLRAVGLAREHSLLVAVRGAGHNIAGNAVCDGGLMIDLSPMRSVWVDRKARTARVGPGATLGDFDHEAQAFGLATPLGINSTTGVAGLTLGGGFGWLTRKYGMSVDNLLSADVVLADGRCLRASEEENADLFWGIRGGGGNLGVVTSFEFRLHPVGPEVLCGLIVYPFDAARGVFDGYRQFVARAPEELAVWALLRKAPPLPFLPETVHGKEIMALVVFWAGKPAEGAKVIEPLRTFGRPVGEHVGVQPYTQFQSAFDPLLAPGARNYWKSHDFSSLADGAVDVVLDFAGRLPSPQCEIFIGQLGGAMSRVDPTATAYPHRDANFVMNVHTRWESARQDEECVRWARSFFQATAPYSTGGVYVNFLGEDEKDRVQAAYGGNYDRLAELKAKYDPDNLFRLNQNIQPSKHKVAARAAAVG